MTGTGDVGNFDSEVLKRSHEIPVLVDFWATWCGACRVLSPQLEVLRERHRGEWELVKVNTESNPALSRKYNISSIPTIKLFSEGKIIGEFSGALPGHVIEQWLAATLPPKPTSRLDRARRYIAEGRTHEAEELLSSVHAEDPHNHAARILLARLIVLREPARAQQLLAGIEPVGVFGEMVEAIEVIAAFMVRFLDSSDLPASTAKTPLLQAISALYGNDIEYALENLVNSIGADASYLEGYPKDVARALLTYLGPDNTITQKYRQVLEPQQKS